MLLSLSIRDIVLIDRLDLVLKPGLCVLTGETGAGKSILLDALGLALGERGDATLLRQGREQGSVTAVFEPGEDRDLEVLLEEHAIERGDTIILRRTIGADGRGRAFINDQPVSIGLLRQVGEILAEIQVQSESHRLLAPANHRRLVDSFGGCDQLLHETRRSHAAWQLARTRLAEEQAALAGAATEEEFLRHAVSEFAALDPKPDEEDRLAKERDLLRHGEKVAQAVREALAALQEGTGVESRLRLAERQLGRVAVQAAGVLAPALQALERATVETAEAVAAIEAASQRIDLDPNRLERLEERLFALRASARKHRCAVADLPGKWADLSAALGSLEDGSVRLAARQREVAAARQSYEEVAERLSDARGKAAAALDRAVAREFAPLHLPQAKFRTVLTPLTEPDWSTDGRERVVFEAITNRGQPFGPLAKIASGGELSRFMLALQVALAGRGGVPTLVFDEADAGVGGAVAAAVGERLARLAEGVQVLVVTHSPQVAARGAHHWRISKGTAGGRVTTTKVEPLTPDQRREEIARMLAGAEVTAEARAAADRLLHRSHGDAAA